MVSCTQSPHHSLVEGIVEMRLDWRFNRPTKGIERNVSPFNIMQLQLFSKVHKIR